MIVDTLTLIAILTGGAGAEQMVDDLESETALLPAPARVEFMRVAAGVRLQLGEIAGELLAEWDAVGLATIPFDAEHARIAAQANSRYGRGMEQGGVLNVLDLMVYAVAKERGEPLLCTGKDFAATDIELHAASRAY